jgi:hypothetical protein
MAELIIGKNSFMDVAEADKIISDNYMDTDNEYQVWNSLSENNKSALIIKYTKYINNESLLYRGKKVDITQNMEFPRDVSNDDQLSGIYDNDILDCPDEIKLAIVSLAVDNYISSQSEEAAMIRKGIQTYKIKDASVTFNTDKGNNNNINIGGVGSMPRSIWDSCFKKYSHISM